MSRSRVRWALLVTSAATLLPLGLVPSLDGPAVAATSWLDPTFGGGDGRAQQGWDADLSGTVADSAVAPDGDLVVALVPAHGIRNCCNIEVGATALARLDATGALDPGFGQDGVVGPAPSAPPGSVDSVRPDGLAVDSAGRPVVVGGRQPLSGTDEVPVLVRRTPTGALDPGFGSGGTAVLPQVPACYGSEPIHPIDVVALAGGKLLVAGVCSSADQAASDDTVLTLRYTATGALDPTYSGDGVRPWALPKNVGGCCGGQVQQLGDGRIVIALPGNDGTILRLQADGTPDTAFGGGDGVTQLPDVVGWPFIAFDDGTMVVASTRQEVRHLDADGTLDPSYGDTGAASFATTDVCLYPELAALAGTPARVVGLVTCSRGPDHQDNGGTVLSAVDGTGALDPAFGTHTSVVRATDNDDFSTGGPSALRADGSGFLLLGADNTPGVRVERRTSTGAVDSGYATGGARHVRLPGRLFSLVDSHAARDAQGRLVSVVLADNRGLGDEACCW
jgi:uncharacterized delta-60 repeat protein